MTQFLDMLCYDIHTHHCGISSGDTRFVYNSLVGEDFDPACGNHCFLSCGIHPWHIGDVALQQEQLKQTVGDGKVLLVGEAGLDKCCGTSLELQQAVFEYQCRLSEEVGKPLVVHCVKAWSELLHIKKRLKPSQPWIIHGFRGKPELARQLLDNGCLLSFGEHFNRDTLVFVAASAPFFAETDESALPIETVYRRLADALDCPVETLAGTIAGSVRRVLPSLFMDIY